MAQLKNAPYIVIGDWAGILSRGTGSRRLEVFDLNYF